MASIRGMVLAEEAERTAQRVGWTNTCGTTFGHAWGQGCGVKTRLQHKRLREVDSPPASCGSSTADSETGSPRQWATESEEEPVTPTSPAAKSRVRQSQAVGKRQQALCGFPHLLAAQAREINVAIRQYIQLCMVPESSTAKKWNMGVVGPATRLVGCLSGHFANVVRDVFSPAFVRRFTCHRCGLVPAQERCHGFGFSRPYLLEQAILALFIDDQTPLSLLSVVVEFLKRHEGTGFGFMCHECHLLDRPAEMQLRRNKQGAARTDR